VAIDAFGGAPTELHFCDTSFVTQKTAQVEYVKLASFGEGRTLRCSQEYSADEIKKLTDFLVKLLADAKAKAITVDAKKEGTKYVISFVVDKEKWDNKDSWKVVAQAIADEP